MTTRTTETQDQIALFDLLARLESRYPLLQFVAHPANESGGGQKVRTTYRKRDGSIGYRMTPVDVLRDARMGSKPGIPDILVFCMNRAAIEGQPAYYYTGLAIERKSARGVVSDDQQRWLRQLSREGWYTMLSTDWTAEARLILTWVGGDLADVGGL